MYLKATIRNTIAVLSLNLLAGLAGYAFRILLAHNVTVTDYGLFYSMLSFLSLFTVFIDIGMTQSLAKAIAEHTITKSHDRIKSLALTTLGLQLTLSTICAIFFLFLYPKYASHLFQTSSWLPFILLVSWFVTLPLEMFFKSLFWGLHSVKLFALIDPIKNIMACVIAALLFLAGYGMITPFFSYAFLNILAAFILLFPLVRVFPKFFRVKFHYQSELFKKIIFYGGHLAFASLAWSMVVYMDSIMISFFNGTEEVGLYQAALPLAYSLLYVVGALNMVAYPLFTKLSAAKKSDLIRQGVTLLYKYLFVGMIPLALIIISFPEIAISVLFGAKFIPAANALRVLTIGTLLFSMASFNTSLLIATGHARALSKLAIITALLNVILNFTLIPTMKSTGAAIATTISFALMLATTLYIVRRVHKVKLPLARWLLNFVAGLIVVWIIAWLKKLLQLNVYAELTIILITAFIVYVALVFLFKITTMNELVKFLKTALR